jgi:O-acetylserine/cysteine efflux transporter
MTAPPEAHHGLRLPDLLVAAGINILWGLNIIASKMAVMATAPFTAAFLRQFVVLLVCLPFLRIVPGRMRALLAVGVVAGAAFLIAINLSLLVSDNLPALAIAGQLGVPFALILAVIFLGERIALPRLLGIAFTFVGVVVLVFDPAGAREVPGLLLTALSALLWSIASLLQRQLAGVPVLTIYAWIGLVGAIILGPIALLTEPETIANLPALPLRDFGWILFSAIGATVLGQGGMAWLLQRHPITAVTPLTLASPVIAIMASSFFFGTVLTPTMIMGGMIAMTGVAIITIRSAGSISARSTRGGGRKA